MSLLTICENVANEVGFRALENIVSNGDDLARQLHRLANREGEALSQLAEWEVLISEGTISLVTGDQDYALPADFRYLIPSTTWNRDDNRYVTIPVTSEEWQYLKGWTIISGLNLRARIRANQMEFEQTIAAADNGKIIAFEYISKYWAQDASGTAQQFFTSDTDTAKLDEELITQGVVWRFKKAKGLDWQEDYLEYKNLADKQKARTKGSRKLRLTSSSHANLGVNTPEGNFG